jgi:murein DD-endopeptidase MepM/ murein hydrolase activator NlpD
LATNGNDGNNQGGTIRYTNEAVSSRGISGAMQERSVKSSFARDVWRNEGYLSSAIKDMQELVKLYTNLQGITDKMSKSEQKAAKDKLSAAKDYLDYTNQIKESGEVSDKEAIDMIKAVNKLKLEGQKEYVKILETAQLTQEEIDKNHLQSLESARNEYSSIKTQVENTSIQLTKVSKTLDATGKSFATNLSDTLSKAGDRLSSLSNMFNLSKIADNTANQQLKEINTIKTSVNQQFGFTSSAQFDEFANSLNDTLKEMNSNMDNLFSMSDMTQYLQNLSEYGVTNTQLAQDSMKDSLIATKYLGASTETMTQMFKFMKLTNNSDTISKYNRTMVGLMKSQLGLSADQLSALSEIAYGSTEDKLALGMTADAVEAQNEALSIGGSALEAMYGEDVSKSILSAFNDFMLNPDSESWRATLGTDYNNIYNTAFSGTTVESQQKAFNDFLNAIANSNMVGVTSGSSVGTAIANKTLNGITDLNSSVISALKGFDDSTYQNEITNALDSINSTTDEMVEQFVEQSTEATWLEKIQNWLETTIGTNAWNMLPFLANAAFTAYLASDLLKGGKFIVDCFKGSGKNSISGIVENTGSTVSETSSLASAFKTGTAVVALTAATISAMATISDKLTSQAQSKYANEATEALAGTEFEGNNALIGSYATTQATEHKSFWQKNFGSLASGASYFASGIVGSKDGSYKNEKLIKWMYDTGYIDSKAKALTIAYIMDSIGDLSAFNSAMGTSYTHDDLKQLLDTEIITKDTIDQEAQYIFNKGGYSFYNDDGSRFKSFNLDLNGYKKNGLVYVPKDNYKALLHQGEMILTADEANQYRNMMNIDRYGNTLNAGGSIGIGGSANVGGDSDSSWTSIIHSPWTRISSMWGSRPNPFGGNGNENHGGMDIAAPQGTPIGAPISGKVYTTTSGYGGGFGNSVYLQGSNGMNYILAHMVSKPKVSSGDSVTAGQVIGYVGSTGRSTGPHLHFQVDANNAWNKANTVDPVPYLNTGVLYPGGEITGVSGYSSSSSTSSSSTSSSGQTVSTTKFIPKAFKSSIGGPADDSNTIDSATKITNSVDNGFKNLIAYLDSIREEQENQRALLNTFAQSRISESNF